MQGHSFESCDLREREREDWCGCLVIREADITGGNFHFQLGLSCLLCIQYAVMQLELLVPFLILVFWFSCFLECRLKQTHDLFSFLAISSMQNE